MKVAASAPHNRAKSDRLHGRLRYIWLVDVVANAQGFSGTVAYASAGAADVGARVNFTEDAVREWKFRGVGEAAAVKFSHSAFVKANAGGPPRVKTKDER